MLFTTFLRQQGDSWKVPCKVHLSRNKEGSWRIVEVKEFKPCHPSKRLSLKANALLSSFASTIHRSCLAYSKTSLPVAADCTFIRVSGSELVQKYIGEGSRMVRELFVMAREHAPSIIFMDEIDSIGSARMESGGGGDSEVQRTMLELLNQLDGFEATNKIKVRRKHLCRFLCGHSCTLSRCLLCMRDGSREAPWFQD